MTKEMLEIIEKYYRKYTPVEYLFNGQLLKITGEMQYTESSIRQFLNKYTKEAGIKKKVHPHLIRHCYGTHQIEAGMDSIILQDILGHKSINTTNTYKHLATRHYDKLSNPLTPIL